MNVLKTPRLFLRHLTLDALGAVTALYSDPVVMTTNGGVRSPELIEQQVNIVRNVALLAIVTGQLSIANITSFLLLCFHKAEVFLILCQEQASELNEPVMGLLQKIVHLVAHPVAEQKRRFIS